MPHFARQREIVEVLTRNGLDLLVAASGLAAKHPRSTLLKALAQRQVHDEGITQPAIVRRTLEELGPTFVKMGQVLGTRRDLVTPEFADELAKLQDRMIPVPVEKIRAVVEAELGAPVEEVFASFSSQALGSASLGQVHAATLRDGRPVVVKVLRPGIEAVVESDLAILGDVAARLSRVWDSARDLNLTGFVEEFGRQLHGEMDYRSEGRNAEQIAENFARRRGLHVPTIHWEYTTQRVLTMEHITGLKVSDIAGLDAARIDRRALGRRASRIILDMVLVDGFFHADPHPGNMFIEPDGTIGLIDFGMVGTLNAQVQAQLLAMVVSFASRDSTRLSDALLAFAPPRGNVDRIRLNREIDRLVRAYVDKPLAEVDMVEIVDGLLDITRTHHLRPPTEITLIGRMLALLDAIGRTLDPKYSMVEVLKPYIDTLMRRRLRPDQLLEQWAALLTETAELGAHAPRRLLRILARYDQEGVKVAVDAETLEPYMRRFEQLGDRLVVGFVLGSAISAVGNLGATDDKLLVRVRAPLLLAGSGVVAMLTRYLMRTGRRR